MATIKGKTLFFTTSPRTPQRFIPEIQLLSERMPGRKWDKESQLEYMYILIDQDFYQGSKTLNDPALSARDRINRAPKALGFIDLSPTIKLTPAGKALIESRHKEEPLLRQLLKFQLPSPFHKLPNGREIDFWVKPYLEILRLVRDFGSITFDEVQLFGMQITDYRKYDKIVEKIKSFRKAKALNTRSYKRFFAESAEREIREIYSEEFESGDMHVRESSETTAKKFIDTKKSNLRDYTDACFRYLRATSLVSISQSGRSLSIAFAKEKEVDFILETVDRNPVYVDDANRYKRYLFDNESPRLYSDNRENLLDIIWHLDRTIDCQSLSLVELKDLQYDLIDSKKKSILAAQSTEIKDYRQFDDIIDVFKRITLRNSYYDQPLMFEWNTWRAMTMIDGGSIRANLNFDDLGEPLSTASGNKADIECDYGSFMLNVEVTLQSGQKQYDNEGEPVARHVGKTKQATGKETYCFFIAPTISAATIAHFYVFQATNIRHYGGRVNIIPLELATFVKMVIDSKQASYVPEPRHIEALALEARRLAGCCSDELDWFNCVRDSALNWLSPAM